MSVNKVILLGRIGRDPEARKAGDSDVTNFSVATSETWKDKATGERKERTQWHRVTVFGQPATYVSQYGSKGDMIYVEGQLETRKYTDKNNIEREATEVVVRNYGGKVTLISSQEKKQSSKPKEQVQGDLIDDDIPF